jgi:hypothetical protein
MGSALTTYRPGAVQTVTSGGGGTGSSSLQDLIEEMIRRKRAALQKQDRPTIGFGKATGGPIQGGGHGGGSMGREGDRSQLLDQQLKQAQVAMAKAQAHAATSRVPTRMSTVGGQTFATPDALMMTGAQRQMFLPNNAAMQQEDEERAAGLRQLRYSQPQRRFYGGPYSEFLSEEEERAAERQGRANAVQGMG